MLAIILSNVMTTKTAATMSSTIKTGTKTTTNTNPNNRQSTKHTPNTSYDGRCPCAIDECHRACYGIPAISEAALCRQLNRCTGIGS